MIKVTNLSSCLKTLKENGFWVIGLDGNTDKELSHSMFANKTAIILGSEESGLRRLTKENCDFIAKINISSNAESLNVSNAAAIALYEIANFHKA
jgi:23S rRNA (guanosine2251-2'-O)-methyltransferase